MEVICLKRCWEVYRFVETFVIVIILMTVMCFDLFSSRRLYAYEVEKSCDMNENLGNGIAVFQGMSNIALNCECNLMLLTL